MNFTKTVFVHLLLIALTFVSCGQSPSKEQRKRYRLMQESLVYDVLTDNSINDSLRAILQPVTELSLEDYMEKNHIALKDLDNALMALELTQGAAVFSSRFGFPLGKQENTITDHEKSLLISDLKEQSLLIHDTLSYTFTNGTDSGLVLKFFAGKQVD